MDALDKAQMLMALRTIEALVEHDAASSISLEWSAGQPPEVRYTSTVPLEYVAISFSIVDKP
jgi:hypothetical protein